jgi:Uri superfamily endonuclease
MSLAAFDFGSFLISKRVSEHARECDLVAMLAPLPMPIPGFGSSDCSRCLSHLLYLPPAALPVVSPAYIRQR